MPKNIFPRIWAVCAWRHCVPTFVSSERNLSLSVMQDGAEQPHARETVSMVSCSNVLYHMGCAAFHKHKLALIATSTFP